MLEFTVKKFDRLSESIGTTADALLYDLKGATGGLISDMELMASATDFMTLGLVKTHDEAVRLTSVAGQLGMNMNQLVLTLTNQTMMRFDALGVATDGFKEKVKALTDTGMNANDAFNEAFLQQAEEQIEKVGSIADSSAASFLRMEAAVKNLANKIKGWFVPGLKAAADGLYYVLTYTKQVDKAFQEHKDNVAKSAKNYDEYATEVLRASVVAKVLNDNQAEAVRMFVLQNTVLPKNIDNVHKWVVETGLLTEAQWGATYSTEAQTKATHGAIEKLLSAKDATEDLGTAVEATQESMEKYKALLAGELGKENENYRKAVEDLKNEAGELRDRIGELGSKKYLTKDQKEELGTLRTELDEVNKKIKEQGEEHDKTTKKILLNMIEQRLGLDGLTVAEQNFLFDLAGNWGLVDQATLLAWDKVEKYIGGVDDATIASQGFLDIISKIPKELTIKVRADFISNIPSWIIQNANLTLGGGGSGSHKPEKKALGGGVLSGQPVQWGEYGRTEMFMPNTSGQVVNAQQIVESLRSSGVNLGGDKPGIGTINVYTNSGVDAIQYSIQRAQGYAL